MGHQRRFKRKSRASPMPTPDISPAAHHLLTRDEARRIYQKARQTLCREFKFT
jgi:hypothetical protein